MKGQFLLTRSRRTPHPGRGRGGALRPPSSTPTSVPPTRRSPSSRCGEARPWGTPSPSRAAASPSSRATRPSTSPSPPFWPRRESGAGPRGRTAGAGRSALGRGAQKDATRYRQPAGPGAQGSGEGVRRWSARPSFVSRRHGGGRGCGPGFGSTRAARGARRRRTHPSWRPGLGRRRRPRGAGPRLPGQGLPRGLLSQGAARRPRAATRHRRRVQAQRRGDRRGGPLGFNLLDLRTRPRARRTSRR